VYTTRSRRPSGERVSRTPARCASQSSALSIPGTTGAGEQRPWRVAFRLDLSLPPAVPRPPFLTMPDEDSPDYEAWKNQIAKELTALDGELILVGHSLGGSILLRYLSEEKVQRPVAGLSVVCCIRPP
jgi:predicted alpha/beta hydrolase family esterase